MSTQETEPEVPQEPEPAETPESPEEPEPENPDAEPAEPIEGPGETPEEPQQAPPSEPSSYTLNQVEEKKLTAEQKRHTSKVSEILGDNANEAVVCPFCDPLMQGFFYMGDLAHPRDELQARMAVAYLQPEQAEFLPDPDVERCARCDGLGKTDTRSRVPGQERVVCKRCKGAGYYPPPGTAFNGAVTGEEGRQLVAVGSAEPVIEDQDAWGSPRLMADGQENPNYGKMPQYKNPALP
jgi:hypothetical protein